MGRSVWNILKTALLFGVLWGVLLAVGYALGGHFIWIFAIIGLVGTFISFWNSDTIAIRSMRAQEVSPQEAPQLYRIVQDLANQAGQPMPRLYISPTQQPNAFATGRSPQRAAVCCTQGILQILDERELRGVLGHELMHVYNRDILTSSVAAGIAGVITSLAQMALWFGGGRDREGGGGIVGALLAMILAPIAATLIQLAISRTREYSADHDGADLTGDPLALASALQKISGGVAAHPLPKEQNLQDSAHMMIANPFKGGGMGQLFSTHPPTEQRIARLQQQAQQMGPR
ncbi:zinc metalloprotease HtpX [Brachybacterium endophyticum]|uniref:Protease HtpX homolog n=1 Tax=Brachybacterium endophyticum TaxID=2182385 RepID=A0A2U2RH04_9MICO|nr:zinc metalloprotease HtpX [Brachybacterium endophyticum]PWH05134.1 zinc metalloprotease HtpX [Brachybacterium endophyticum]